MEAEGSLPYQPKPVTVRAVQPHILYKIQVTSQGCTSGDTCFLQQLPNTKGRATEAASAPVEVDATDKTTLTSDRE
jgi:hypothetical protein